MKKLLVSIMLMGLGLTLSAQEETLLRSGEVTHGGFGGPVVKFSEVNGEFALFVGGRGGWIINSTVSIGGGGYGLVNQVPGKEVISGTFRNLQMGYGGLEIELILASDRVVHATIFGLIGGGGLNYQGWDKWSNFDFSTDSFFAAELAMNAEINLTGFFRLTAGAGYRFISGVDFGTLSNSDLDGFTGTLTFKFGSF
jgi:hypothetical protein